MLVSSLRAVAPPRGQSSRYQAQEHQNPRTHHIVSLSPTVTQRCVFFLRLRRPRRIPENLSRKKKLGPRFGCARHRPRDSPLFSATLTFHLSILNTHGYYCATIHFLVRQLCCVRGCSAKKLKKQSQKKQSQDQARLRARSPRTGIPRPHHWCLAEIQPNQRVFVSPTVLGTELPNQYTGNKRTNIELGELDG